MDQMDEVSEFLQSVDMESAFEVSEATRDEAIEEEIMTKAEKRKKTLAIKREEKLKAKEEAKLAREKAKQDKIDAKLKKTADYQKRKEEAAKRKIARKENGEKIRQLAKEKKLAKLQAKMERHSKRVAKMVKKVSLLFRNKMVDKVTVNVVESTFVNALKEAGFKPLVITDNKTLEVARG